MHCNQGYTRKVARLVSILCVVSFLCSVSACKVAPPPENSADAWYVPYVDICVDKGIMDTPEDTSSLDQPLLCDELQVILIRLYNHLHGGDGTVPPLPDNPLDYLQFLDGDGVCVAGVKDVSKIYAADGGIWVEFTGKPPSDELTLKMAFPGDRMYLHTQGSFIAGGIDTEVDPYSASGLLQAVSPGEHYIGTVIPDHYFFPVDTETPADTYVHILSGYQFMIENNGFDDYSDTGHYPYIYYLLFREGHVSTEAIPRERENPDLSLTDAAWREDLAIYLADYCPELIPDVSLSEDSLSERYTYRQNIAIQGLYQAGVFAGINEDENFDGQQPLTRAECAVVIARLLSQGDCPSLLTGN